MDLNGDVEEMKLSGQVSVVLQHIFGALKAECTLEILKTFSLTLRENPHNFNRDK